MDRPLTPRALSNKFCFSVLCGLLILGLQCVQSGTTKSSSCDLRRQFPCRTAPHICIEISRVRDGRSDCPDGSDEECPEGMHRCVCGLPRCIERNKVGDGIKHCQDGSDEGEDGSNYLCTESSSEEDLLAVEMKKRRRRATGNRNDPVVYPTGLISTFVGTEVNGDQTTLHTTHRYRTYVDGSYTELLQSTSMVVPTPTLEMMSEVETTASVQKFGSLNSGKVFLTAVNEPVSAMSSKSERPITVTGTFIPPEDQENTKHFGLDLQAQTVGILFPEKTEASIITVTGTKGTFINADSSTDRSFPVYTGSYVSGQENPTTYKFFFGNHPLTSKVQVILPTTSKESNDYTERFDAEESELRASVSKEDNDNLLLDSSLEKEIPEPYYRSENKSGLYRETIPTSRPETNRIAVTRFIQPTAYPETDEPVFAVAGRNTVGIVGNIRKPPQQTSTLRGHDGLYRQGRMYNPSPAGRRIGTQGVTVVTDQYFFPDNKMEKNPADDDDADNKDVNNAYYDINGSKLKDELRNIVKPTTTHGRNSVKDYRLTRTVGLYGPIYEFDDLQTNTGNGKSVDALKSLTSSWDSDNGLPSDVTTTLYGFAEFSTRISGTHYIFLPASTRPRTFTPRVTRTSFSNGIPVIPRSQSPSSKADMNTESFFRKPLFGTETREYVSQDSMFTSTIRKPTQIEKTMLTSTVNTRQFSNDFARPRKVEDFATTSVVAETLPLNLASIYERESVSSRKSDEKDLFLNFTPLKNYDYMTSSLASLEVSEIVDGDESSISVQPTYPTGLVSSITGTEISDGTTTHWTTLIFGTYIDNTYAHVIESTSSIFYTVSKTINPEETLAMEVAESDESFSDGLHDELKEDKLFSLRNTIELHSSLSDLSSRTSLMSNYEASEVLATPTLEILTSGFILPNNEYSEYSKNNDVTSSFLNLGISTHSSPEIVYEKEHSKGTKSENEPVHIITDSFILPERIDVIPSPTVKKTSDLETEANFGMKSQDVSSTYLNDLDRLITGLSVEDTDNQKDSPVRDTTDKEKNSEKYTSSEFVFLTGDFILPSVAEEELSSRSSETDELISSEISASILTGDFILPNKPSKDKSNDLSVHSLSSPLSSSLRSSSILTEGFILPSYDLQEIPSLSKEITPTPSSTLSILTDGFILPELNADRKSFDSSIVTVNALPSSALLTAEYPLNEDNNEIGGRSAGDDDKKLVFDDLVPADSSLENSENSTLRSGKALFSVKESVNKPKSDQILSSIAFPITYFTTSTYFTTYLLDGSTAVSSRKETVSNVYTDSEQLKLAKINPTETIIMPYSIKPTRTEDPNDYFTTFTYYTTFYKDGTKIVTSRVETEGSSVKETPTPAIESQPAYSVLTYPTTYYTTLTYFTTLLRGSSSEVISSETVVSNVVTPLAGSKSDFQPSLLLTTTSKTLQTPTTYFTTYTYYTTFHKDGTTSVSTNYQTVSNVIYGKENIVSTPVLSSVFKTESPERDENYIPTTYFTTYTYYTTYLRAGTPVVSSREETVTSVGRKKVTNSVSLTNELSSLDSPKETTYYTTYTYYTTLLKEGTTTVSTRKETVSNVLSGTSPIYSKPLIVRTDSPESTIKPSVQEKTYFTTYTYYTTLLREGTPVISTRESTVTNIVTDNTYSTIPSTTTPTRNFATYFTTLTSYYTLFNAGIPSVSTVYSTLTDIVALKTPIPNDEPTKSINIISSTPITTTYYTTYTYFTTLLNSGSPEVSTKEIVKSNIVILMNPQSISSTSTATTLFSLLNSQAIQPTAVLTKTLYTTYTFYSTYFFPQGTPSISTRLETATNYVTETITRTQNLFTSTPSLTSHFSSTVYGSFSEKNSFSQIDPTNAHSSATYYTLPINGDFSDMETNTRVLSAVFNQPDTLKYQNDEKSVISPSVAVNTIYTTFTYYTTLFPNGTPLIQTRYETKSNMITLTISPTATEKIMITTSDLEAAEGGLHENRVHPTPVVTYYSTHTYLTTSIKPNGETSYITRKVVATATVEQDERKGTILEPSTLETAIYPYTFYTTYTYYTTRFHGNNPIINTRYETITNVIKAPVTAPVVSETTIISSYESKAPFYSKNINDIVPTSTSQFIPTSEASNGFFSIPGHEPWSENKSRKDDGPNNSTIKENIDEDLMKNTDNTENDIYGESTVSTLPISNSSVTTESSYDVSNSSEKSSTNLSVMERTTTEKNEPAVFRNTQEDVFFTTESSSTENPSESTADNLAKETEGTTTDLSTTEKLTSEASTVSEAENRNEEETTTELTTSTTSTLAPTIRSIFSRRRNRPQYKPRPSFRSTTTTTPRSTTLTSRSPNRAITTSKSPIIGRRNATRLFYRRPSLAPRVNPLQRFRPRTTPSSTDTENDNSRRKRSFFRVHEDYEEIPRTRKILSTFEENNETLLKNNDLISENRHTERRDNEKENYPVGLIKSMEAKAINNGVTTVYATEIHGTFINGVYAQVVQSKVKLVSDSSNEIERTPFFHSPVPSPTLERRVETQTNKVGLVSSKLSTLVKDQTTTVFTTNIYGTYIGEVYAHLAQTTSNIITPTPTQNSYPTGLISSLTRSEENFGTATLWTTHIYGTYVNNYYAHIASTFSNVFVPSEKSSPLFTQNTKHYAQATPDLRTATPTGRSIDIQREHPTGLLSSIVSEDEKDGTTTQFITNIYGTYIGQQYAKHAQTTSKVIPPTKTSDISPTRSVGLLSTLVNSIVNGNTATIYKTEIYGTYIGQLYAQLARTSTEYSYIPKSTASFTTPQVIQKTGLLSSSIVRSEINAGTTTMHINEIYGTYIGNAYAHVAKSTYKVIKPTLAESKTSNLDNGQKTGLISSSVKTEVNDGTTTLHIAEVHGTYVGNYYAHVARRTSTVLPVIPTSTSIFEEKQMSATPTKSDGLISSEVKTEVNQGTTTLHTREIYGTYINGYYAHVARSSSNIITPTLSSSNTNSGLVSAITNTEINYDFTTLHTTEIYGTSINGFYAHIARSTSNVISPTPTSRPVGIISTTISTEVNNDATTLHRTSLIGLEVDGTYTQSVKATSTVIYASPFYLESLIKPTFVQESKNSHLGTAKDDLDTARVNELDNGNQYISLTEDSDLGKITPLTSPTDMELLSSSVVSENTVTEPETVSEVFAINTSLVNEFDLKNLFTSNEVKSESINDTSKANNSEKSKIEEPTKSFKKEENTSKDPSDDYNDYNDYANNKAFKDKESITLKPNVRDQSLRKNKAPSLASSRKIDPEEDYDEYAFEDDYSNFESRKFNRKPTPSLASTRFKNTRESKKKSATIDSEDYDDYDDYDYHDSETPSEQTSKSTETSTPKESASSSVRIRPFTGRGRLTSTTPSRSSTKSSFTIQFRRPSRTRNSRAFGHRSDSENDFDDDIHEDDEGDIEASEAVVTTATPQALSFTRRKHFGNSRYQPHSRNSAPSSTTRPVNLGRNRRPFGRSNAANPSPTPSIKDTIPDYDENTTEDDDFDDYEDFSDKKDYNKGSRNFRSTRRPPSRVTRFGERRSASNKRGSFRHREEEETENDDFDATTPNYRNSRNRINQRKPSRGRYNRNNSPLLKSSFNSVSRDDDEEDSDSLQPINRVRGNNRRGRPSYNPRTRRPSKTVTETPTIRKPYLTVTSVVTTVKTLPIYHGFRTSYATLTTTALDTSIINPTQYSEVVSDGITKTVFYSKTGYPDGIENLHTTVTEVVVTTTSLASIKLVPIKIGFSTRTDTVTDIQVLTTLSTVYSTITPDTPQPTAFPQQFQPNFYPQLGPQNPDFGLLAASANSFVTTQIVTSTTVVPIILRGRTILSTLTTTSTSESTVVQTVRIPQVPSPAPFIPQPYFAFQPLTTLLTLYVTGEHGELKPVVTTVTVPLYQQPVFHTKVARSLQQNVVSEHTLKTADFMDLPLSSSISHDYLREMDIDTHYDKLLSSGLEEINDLSEKSSSQMQTEPLDSTRITKIPYGVTTYDVTTISKGPLTEIYEQKVTVNVDTDDESMKQNEIERSKDTYGLESRYSFRRLQQFVEEDPIFRPQRDFTRIRRPPAGIILATVSNPIGISQPNTQSVPVRVRPRQFPPARRPPVVEFSEETTNPEDLRNSFRGSSFARRPLRRPEGNFRPFIERPSELIPPVNDEFNSVIPFAIPGADFNNVVPSGISLETSRTLTSGNGFEPARLQSINGNRNNLNFFVESPKADANNEGFQPITNIQGLRRGPGPALNELPEGSLRSRRLRVTRPLTGEITSGVVRRITRLRSSVTSTPISTVSDFGITSSFDVISPSATFSLEPSSYLPSNNERNILTDKLEETETEKEDNDEGNLSTRRTVIRRLRPSFIPGDGSGGRRPVVVRRTRVNENTISTFSNPEVPTLETSTNNPDPNSVTITDDLTTETSKIESNDDENEANTDGNSKPPVKKIVRLRKPENADQILPGSRRRVVVSRRPQDISLSNTVQGRGPVNSIETTKENAINNIVSDKNHLVPDTGYDIDDLNKIAAVPSKNLGHNSVFSTKVYPITYFTTLTYFTTFVHGPEVNYGSRVAVFSNVIEHTLNPSIINAIKLNKQQPTEVSTVHLASRTLGDTTTIVNLASYQNVYNSEIDKLLDEEINKKFTPTAIVPDMTRDVLLDTSNINAIAQLPKTFLTLFTYSYTFFDGTNRKESTRAETMTKVNNDPSQFLSATVGPTIDKNGLLDILPITRTLHLGSRELEGTTTEVNLGLKTLIKFDNVKNVLLETAQPFQYITPTRTYTTVESTSSVVTPKSSAVNTPPSILLDSSYSSANELYGINTNQDISSGTTPLVSDGLPLAEHSDEKKQVIKVTSVIHKPVGPLRSGVFNPRPGVRVRVKPVASRRIVPSELLSSFDISFDVNDIASEYPGEVPVSPQFLPPSLNVGAIATPVLEDSFLTSMISSDVPGVDNELVAEDFEDEDSKTDGTILPPRKKLKVTVRRPQSESMSRTHTRFVLPSRFEITSRPRFYVVTRTGALGVVSNTQRPFTVKISRKLKPTSTEVIPPSTTVIYDTFTTLTSVPVIFGLETSFRNVLLTTSSPITVSFVPSPTFESDSAVIMPSTVVLTYFTTTTFTIPYLVDDTTLFTTLEETNSRVVTSTLDIPGSSVVVPSAPSSSAAIPTLSLLTSVEFGFDGPVTHTLSSHIIYEEVPSSPIVTIYETPTSTRYEAKTFYTTYTFFTTLYAGTEPVVSSSEQVVTNVVTVPVTTEIPLATPTVSEVLGPVTVFDTSENVITKTSFKTVTFYATLFSDTSSFVTPIEEVQTDLSTITETFTITRTIQPTPSASFIPFVTETRGVVEETPLAPQLEPSIVVTQTLYTTFTNFVTLFQGTDTVVTNLEEIVSNVLTMTVPAHAASSFTTTTPTSTTESFKTMTSEITPVYTTKEIVSTQTHYLTLFNNGESLLSSLEEVVTKYVTELVTALTPSYPSYTSYTSYVPEFDATSSPDIISISSNVLLSSTQSFTPFSSPSEITEEKTSEISTYHPELVPSIRTIYSTLTFYTTYYSDTSSIVATQEEVLTSYVTLFVPPSLITSTTEITSDDIIPTSTTDPSVFVFTTTDYSTLTLYTTLFSGDEIVVISSEHVVPEIITATITPTSNVPTETATKDESVLTFLTTFTYYTTYFSGTDPVIASSESVVTQFVTIEAPPTSTSFSETSIESTPVEETIIGVSTASVANVVSSIDDVSSRIEIIMVSSAVTTDSEIASSIETNVQVESKVHTEIGFSTGFSSPTLLTTDIIDFSSPSKSFSIIENETVDSKHMTSTFEMPKHSESTQSSILPASTSSILTEKTEIVGLDGLITSLAPSDTLVMITGTDGFITKLAELDTGALSPVYIPSTEQISSTSTSEIKPATVIELSDLLGGNTALGGDIGLAIKDIVSLITGKKNKTEEGVTTEKMIDSSTEATEEPIDATTESTTAKETVEIITDSDTKKDDAIADISKDIDYPIFVIPGKEPDSKTGSDILAPVYVPTESIRSVKPELSVTKSMTSSPEEILSSKISKSISTSVITGARTVFIVPTKATSNVDDSKDKYTIEPRQPKIEKVTESLRTTSKIEKEIKTLVTDFILPSPSSSITEETAGSLDFVSKEITSHSSDIKELPDTQPVHDSKSLIVSSLSLLPKESSKITTPELKPSLGTSVISGIRTVFFDPILPKPSKSEMNTISSSVKEEISGRANTGSSTAKHFTTVTKDGQTVISRSTSGATTIFFPGQIPKYTVPVISTRYITSVETITRTLALTTTRTYYTRDSTLTVPSVYTTTIPPRTFVSTIIGSRTILGILPEPTETVQIHKTLEPSERTTTVTTTTLIFNSIPSTVIRTLVLPTGLPTKTVKSETSSSYTVSDSDIFNAGTERPAKPPEVGDSTAIINEESNEENLSAVKPVLKTRDETYLRAANPRVHDQHPDNRLQEARRPPIVVTEAIKPENDPFLNGRNGVCDPKCQPYKKEVCKEKDGFWSCQCRPGHARRDDHEICKEIQTFVVLLKVIKNGNQSIKYNEGLADNDSKEFKEFVKSAREGIADAYSITNVREHIWDAEVNHIIPVDGAEQTDNSNEVTTAIPDQGVIVNFTMQVSKSVSSNLLEQELNRALQLTHMQIGDSALLAAPLSQNVQDYDECLDGRQNDCSLRGTCINIPGTFTCKCNEGFEDMDSNLPGRTCLAKTENCNYCHGRGDCLRDDDDKTFCRCQPMFVGRRCEINGLVLAVALPTAVAVVVLLLCAVLCCCRKCKRKSPTPNNADPGSVFRGIALKGPVGSTLDKKAMIDTSSESSGEHGRKGPYPLEGYQESGDVTPHKSSKRSDLSLNRSLSTGYTTAPVMIPRAKQPQIPNKPMNYTVYDGQVYVW